MRPCGSVQQVWNQQAQGQVPRSLVLPASNSNYVDPLANPSQNGDDVESQSNNSGPFHHRATGAATTSTSTMATSMTDSTSSLPRFNNERTVGFSIDGMSCTMCSNAIQKAVSGIPGVLEASVMLATDSAIVKFIESATCNVNIIKTCIEDIGYTVVDTIMSNGTNKSTSPSSSASSSRFFTTTQAPPTNKVVDLVIEGMSCTMCTTTVRNALLAVDGVETIDVSLATNTARVTCAITTPNEMLKEEVTDVGFTVTEVATVSTGHAEQSAADAELPSDERLQRLLERQQKNVNAKKHAFVWSLLGTLPILTLTMILPNVLPASNAVQQFLSQEVQIGSHSFILEALILCALCTPVQFGSGFTFLKSSYYGIFVHSVLGMDVLVALGTLSSYVYATMALFDGTHEYHFFETSAVLICFVLLGKWMNALAVRRTSEALTQLMRLQAKTAIRITSKQDMATWDPMAHGYQEEIVGIEHVRPGDVIKVLKGASIPADGVLKFGEMSVDESMITGESVPVLKMPGSIALGGTVCVETGSGSLDNPSDSTGLSAGAFVQVTGVGASTALSKIIELVQNAQSRQVPIQSFADTIASYFVPSIVAISLLTYMVWYGLCSSTVVPASWYEGETPMTFSLMFAIACLVISCPCALGLATPTAVMVGTGVGAQHGILMKGGETLEVASKVDAVVFDKTGTLTKGKPTMVNFVRIVEDTRLDSINADIDGDGKLLDEYILWLLGSLERNSEHPLAAAVVEYAERALKSSNLKQTEFGHPSDFQALTGRGATGRVAGAVTVSAGNRAFMRHLGIALTSKAEETMQTLERSGKTAILAAVNQQVCAVLGIADQLKPDASASISHLRNSGIDVWMVTGDNRLTAHSIAQQLNLPTNRVIAEALPLAKVQQVKRLQSQGHVVAMVGDGVNDSPALAESDVGMSVGTGAEIAAEASDIVLVRGNVTDVCCALHLSRVIFRRIKLNLLLSLVYNALAVPIAAGVFYPLVRTRLPPTVAALAMALSSVSVVLSSVSLKLYRPPRIAGTGTAVANTAGIPSPQRQDNDLTEPLLPSPAPEASPGIENV